MLHALYPSLLAEYFATNIQEGNYKLNINFGVHKFNLFL